MKKRLDKTMRKIIFIGIVAAALPLVAVPFLRAHSLTAVSKDRLFQVVWSREGHAIEQEVRNHASNGKTYGEMLARWQVLKDDLVRLGAKKQVAEKITDSMRAMIIRPNGTFPRAHWPVMVRRGWILNTPVWIVITGYPKYVRAPLRGNQLKAPLTHQGGLWDYGTTLFDTDGKDITL